MIYLLIIVVGATIWMGLAWAYVFLTMLISGPMSMFEPNVTILMAELAMALVYAGLALYCLVRLVIEAAKSKYSLTKTRNSDKLWP